VIRQENCSEFRNNELTLDICVDDALRNGFMMTLLQSCTCTCYQLELRMDTIKGSGITTKYYI
jgi:hypothetical protein